MKFKEYVESTSRTWNFQEGIKDLDHSLLGLVDEVGELSSAFKKHVGYGDDIDISNIKEEIGDCTFFLARVLEAAQISNSEGLYTQYDQICVKEVSEDELNRIKQARYVDIVFGLTEAVNSIHQSLVEGNGNNLAQGCADMLSTLASACIYFDTTLVECMDKNIEKLKVRYPEKFNKENALNRDIKAEKEALKS